MCAGREEAAASFDDKFGSRFVRSVGLCSAKILMMTTGIVGDSEVPQMPIELDLLDKLKARVQLAKKIDTLAHQARKEKHEKNWLKEAADAMEIELDSDLDSGSVRLLSLLTDVTDTPS